MKDRVKSVMKYQKPAFWVIALAGIFCIVIAVCFLTNPIENAPDLSFLNYENAISIVADTDEVMAIYCPSSDAGNGAAIQIGAATGVDLAKQLDRWDWKPCKAPRRSLPSPGSVEFIIEDDYRITVHDRKSNALSQYAVVKYQDDVRYYRIDKSDYPDAVALVHTPGRQTDHSKSTIFDTYRSIYEPTPIERIEEVISNEEFCISKLHYQDLNGLWVCEGHTYRYRLEITGRLHNAAMNSAYIVLSNTRDITFDQTWKASGLSSNLEDYFDPADAVIVGERVFS